MPSPSPRDASLRRQRREFICTDTGAPVPAPDPSLLSPLADPDDPDDRRWLPLRRAGASAPVVGFASVAVTELHPLGGVRHVRVLVLLLHLLRRLLKRNHHAISARRG